MVNSLLTKTLPRTLFRCKFSQKYTMHLHAYFTMLQPTTGHTSPSSRQNIALFRNPHPAFTGYLTQIFGPACCRDKGKRTNQGVPKMQSRTFAMDWYGVPTFHHYFSLIMNKQKEGVLFLTPRTKQKKRFQYLKTKLSSFRTNNKYRI